MQNTNYLSGNDFESALPINTEILNTYIIYTFKKILNIAMFYLFQLFSSF